MSKSFHFFCFQPQKGQLNGQPGIPRPRIQGQHIIVQRINSVAGAKNTVPSTMNSFGLPLQIGAPGGITLQKATVMTGMKLLFKSKNYKNH